ncbi:hypothetical protein T12_3502 [Trichinella patagoniensis]|uniref:Uncharacterized protein n=1 Tax=Trichinella patagoniensis TaxID=990121 RepID=A0A0V0ZDW4_9BILA|nr:hypothetical protein T12_3502 [Trichinella patagoniensis]
MLADKLLHSSFACLIVERFENTSDFEHHQRKEGKINVQMICEVSSAKLHQNKSDHFSIFITIYIRVEEKD